MRNCRCVLLRPGVAPDSWQQDAIVGFKFQPRTGALVMKLIGLNLATGGCRTLLAAILSLLLVACTETTARMEETASKAQASNATEKMAAARPADGKDGETFSMPSGFDARPTASCERHRFPEARDCPFRRKIIRVLYCVSDQVWKGVCAVRDSEADTVAVDDPTMAEFASRTLARTQRFHVLTRATEFIDKHEQPVTIDFKDADPASAEEYRRRIIAARQFYPADFHLVLNGRVRPVRKESANAGTVTYQLLLRGAFYDTTTGIFPGWPILPETIFRKRSIDYSLIGGRAFQVDQQGRLSAMPSKMEIIQDLADEAFQQLAKSMIKAIPTGGLVTYLRGTKGNSAVTYGNLDRGFDAGVLPCETMVLYERDGVVLPFALAEARPGSGESQLKILQWKDTDHARGIMELANKTSAQTGAVGFDPLELQHRRIFMAASYGAPPEQCR